MFSATAAPTPEPVAPAVALAVESDVDVAIKSASPPIASTAAADRNRASVFRLAIVRASEPATDTLPAAPDFASLPKLEPACISASRSRPLALAAPASDASLVAFASVIATPAPIAAEPPVAEPSAVECANGVSDAFNVSRPPAEIGPLGSVAFAAAFAIEAYRREMLLHGLDEIGRTLLVEERIAAYEKGREKGNGKGETW